MQRLNCNITSHYLDLKSSSYKSIQWRLHLALFDMLPRQANSIHWTHSAPNSEFVDTEIPPFQTVPRYGIPRHDLMLRECP